MGIAKIFSKTKIGFWAGDQNNFLFLNPLIEKLSKDYRVEKFDFEGDIDVLEKQMSQVDIAWFEWGNGPIAPASRIESKTPIINRIHRYELYADYPKHINWNRVNKSLFSSPSMTERFKQKFSEEAKIARPIWLPIGVDTELFEFNKKSISKELLYVGRIHPHKNPSLLLQIMAKLVQVDPEYKLTVIGAYHDELFEEFFIDQINKLDLKDNVKIVNKMTQDQLVGYYQQSDFFIITSIIEGLSQASLEAMACGARPLINDYWGSEKGYPAKYIYRTVDEAVDKIINPVAHRIDSRKLVEDTHKLDDVVGSVKSIINELV